MPEEGREDSRPHFVIPYWSATGPGTADDDGDTRPVPGSAPVYACPAIHTSQFIPGDPLDVWVDVGNFGGANTPSQAQVTVWWTEPTTGFVIVPKGFIGYATIEVPGRGGHNTTPVMTKTIDTTSPHVCILARVSHQYDRAGTTPDPIHDRHWAQRNLWATVATLGAPMVFPFNAGNPSRDSGDFVLSVRPVGEGQLLALRHQMEAEPVFVEARLSLSWDEAGRGGDSLSLTLEGLEERKVFLQIEAFGEISPGQFAAFEVEQRLGPGGHITGGIVVALIGA